MSRPGRWAFYTVAFVGFELVAFDMFEAAYFNGEEHSDSVMAVFTLGALVLVLLADLFGQAMYWIGRTVVSVSSR